MLHFTIMLTKMLCVCARAETDAFNNVNNQYFYEWSDMNRSECFWGDRGSGS